MIVQVLVLIVTLSTAAVAGYLLSTKGSSRIILRDSIAGAAIGVLLITLLSVNFELQAIKELRTALISKNPLDSLDAVLRLLPDNAPLRDAMRDKKRAIEIEVMAIASGVIHLGDENEVISEWTRAFQECATSVNATNFVSPDFWLSGSDFSAKQLQVQSAALGRGVAIRRIFIYLDSTELQKLGGLCRMQDSIGIGVRVLSYNSVVSSTAFIKYSPDLKGAIDFVLYDLNRVLLTFPNPKSRRIENGVLSSERDIVDGSRNLFEQLWNISETPLSRHGTR